MRKILTKEIKEEIINFYKSKPMTIEDVAKEYDYCKPTISKILKDIPKYSKVKIFSPNLVEDYFENIDSELKAYFLGLVITDGCICTSSHGWEEILNITLIKEDKYILDKFIEEIKSNKISTSDGRGCYSINILSNKMCNSLKKYGITERKSLKTVFPKNINKEFVPDMIRGIIDGDGSIAFYSREKHGRKVHKKAIRLCQGNKKFLEDIVDYLFDEYGIKKVSVFKEKESLWSISYLSNDSLIKLINILYKNKNIYLLRKLETIKLISEELKKYGHII